MLKRLTLLAALCLAPTLCAARPHSHDARHAHMRHAAQAEAPAPEAGAASGPPDWRVQYGYVKGPASGSLGAMLEGRNPAAGAIP